MEPVATLSLPSPGELDLPARSVTIVTTLGLTHEDDGVTVEQDDVGPAGRESLTRPRPAP
jgi:hypothetical protein